MLSDKDPLTMQTKMLFNSLNINIPQYAYHHSTQFCMVVSSHLLAVLELHGARPPQAPLFYSRPPVRF